MSHQDNIRIAKDLGFYKSRCDILQSALASVLRITDLDSEYFQGMADMDLEEEKGRVLAKVEAL